MVYIRKLWNCVVFLVCAAVIVHCDVTEDCKQANVDLEVCNNITLNCCLGRLSTYESDINKAVVPILDEEHAREHCRLYDGFETCMEKARPNCNKGDRLLFEGIEAAYKFWCVETFDKYLEYQPCLSNTDLHADGERCSESFDDSFESINYTRGSHYVAERKCHYAENYLDCVYNAVKHHCSADAARWQSGFDARHLKPTLDAMGCLVLIGNQDKRDENNKDDIILVALLASLGVVFVAIIILVVFVCLKYRKARRERENTGPEVEPPPPYAVVYDPVTGAMVTGASGEAGPLPDKMAQPPSYSNHGFSDGGRPDRRGDRRGERDYNRDARGNHGDGGRSVSSSNSATANGSYMQPSSENDRRPSKGSTPNGSYMQPSGENRSLAKQSDLTYQRF